MRFSVLVPVYNVENYLEQCLDSIIAQTFKDFEIILADDGSTDNSGKICDEYSKRYPDIVKVYHKKNEGLLLTRRFELKKSIGEYIIFVDSDDYVSKDLLSIVNDTIKKYKCDMVVYNFNRFIDGEKKFTSPKIKYPSGTVFEGENKHILFEDFLLNHTFVNMWVKAVKRTAIDIEFDYTYWNSSICEDVIQSFALFNKASKIVYIDKKLYFYRKNRNSMTMQIKADAYKGYLSMCDKSLEYINIWQMSQSIKEDFAVRQVSKFYYFLRNLEKTSREIGNKKLLIDTIIDLSNDEKFRMLLELYNSENIKLNLKIRLNLFKIFMWKKNSYYAYKLIKLSNLFEGKF